MPNEQRPHSEAAVFALRALAQSSQPLTATKIAKAIPKSALKSKKDLPELLRQMVKAGQVHSNKARSRVYWLPDLESQAVERILEALSEMPLTQTDLKNKLRSLLVGWPQAKRDEMLAQLIKERRVYKVAPLTGKATLLSRRSEPSPQDYIKLALQLAVARLKPMGLTAEEVFAATQELLRQRPIADKPPVQPERIIQLKLAAANGALVSLTELRRSLAAEIPEKEPFDKAVLRLAEQGVVVLHRHDYPSSLTQEERDALVSDERGNYFVGISKV